MNSKLQHRWTLPQTSIGLLVIIVLLIGVFFRCVNLEQKIYWYDESFTSLRVSGYKEADLIQQGYAQGILGIQDLQKYQRVNPEKTLADTLNSLAVEDAQHPPLYYVFMRFWVQWFGNSIGARRSLSVLISLLVFPCLYWLCWELFESALVGWVAIALIAVSPFHVLYAQEAREYSLWTLTILLSSAALLQAMRLKTKLSWEIYALTISLGFYTFTLSVLVAIGHGIYLAAMEGWRFTNQTAAYLLASLAGFVTFVPWLWVIAANLSHVQLTTDWLNHGDRWYLVQQWLFNICTLFFDLDFPHSWKNPFPYLITILSGYAIYFLYRHSEKRIWLFLLILIATTTLPLLLPDLITGGQRSGISRFLIPCHLVIHLAVAYLLARQIISPAMSIRQQKLWQFLMVTLICAGVLSCVVSSPAKVWWTKYHSYDNPPVAAIVNQANHPLLISKPGNAVALSYLLHPKVKFQLALPHNIPIIPPGYNQVFLYDSGHELQSGYEQQGKYKLVLAYQPCFWKLVEPK